MTTIAVIKPKSEEEKVDEEGFSRGIHISIDVEDGADIAYMNIMGERALASLGLDKKNINDLILALGEARKRMGDE